MSQCSNTLAIACPQPWRENFGTRLPLTYNVIITTITNYHLR